MRYPTSATTWPYFSSTFPPWFDYYTELLLTPSALLNLKAVAYYYQVTKSDRQNLRIDLVQLSNKIYLHRHLDPTSTHNLFRVQVTFEIFWSMFWRNAIWTAARRSPGSEITTDPCKINQKLFHNWGKLLVYQNLQVRLFSSLVTTLGAMMGSKLVRLSETGQGVHYLLSIKNLFDCNTYGKVPGLFVHMVEGTWIIEELNDWRRKSESTGNHGYLHSLITNSNHGRYSRVSWSRRDTFHFILIQDLKCYSFNGNT